MLLLLHAYALIVAYCTRPKGETRGSSAINSNPPPPPQPTGLPVEYMYRLWTAAFRILCYIDPYIDVPETSSFVILGLREIADQISQKAVWHILQHLHSKYCQLRLVPTSYKVGIFFLPVFSITLAHVGFSGRPVSSQLKITPVLSKIPFWVKQSSNTFPKHLHQWPLLGLETVVLLYILQ